MAVVVRVSQSMARVVAVAGLPTCRCSPITPTRKAHRDVYRMPAMDAHRLITIRLRAVLGVNMEK
jgi:hypothetical protein